MIPHKKLLQSSGKRQNMDINGLIEKIHHIVDNHRLAEGQYARYLWQDEKKSRKMGVNEYGCADAANILYTIGVFPGDPDERARWTETLQGMQDPQSGLYYEGTHHTIHTTAHCTAALELFDARPRYPLTGMKKYLDREGLYELLEGLDWGNSPWNNAHQGAGVYAALTITGEVDAAWRKDYFAWLTRHNDPETGLGITGHHGGAPLCHQLFGWFHYFFNYEHDRMPIPNVERVIDSCIRMYQEGGLPEKFGETAGFMEIDWVYTMNRASRLTAYRFEEVKELLWDFAQSYLPKMEALDRDKDESLNDLHALFGMTCALAELQAALPGKIRTEIPLKLVLDRRPFI